MSSLGWIIPGILLLLAVGFPVVIYFGNVSSAHLRFLGSQEKILEAAAEFYAVNRRPPKNLLELVRKGLTIENFLYKTRIIEDAQVPGSFTLQASGSRTIIIKSYDFWGNIDYQESYDLEQLTERFGIHLPSCSLA